MSYFAGGSIVIEDFDEERSITHVNLQVIDPAYANIGSVTQDLDEIKDGILGVIVGKVRYTRLNIDAPEDGAEVTNIQAAREGKWLVTYKDTTQYLDALNAIDNPGYGQPFKFEIGTADRTKLTSLSGSDELDLLTGAGAALVAALEPNIRSPYNQSAEAGVTPTNQIIKVKYVGRNN